MEVSEKRIKKAEDCHWQKRITDNSETLCVTDLKKKYFDNSMHFYQSASKVSMEQDFDEKEPMPVLKCVSSIKAELFVNTHRFRHVQMALITERMGRSPLYMPEPYSPLFSTIPVGVLIFTLHKK